jgi:hypothetical protein
MTMARAELELEIDQALRRLPLPRAPRTLAPRVMRAIAVAARTAAADVRVGWRSWPMIWQALSLVAACSLLTIVGVALPLASIWIHNVDAVRAAWATWRTFFAPMVTPALTMIAVMCVATALLVAALKYVAWEGQWTSQS